MAITYSDNVTVYLDGKAVGEIRSVVGGYQYFPKGSKNGGELLRTIEMVKASLEEK